MKTLRPSGLLRLVLWLALAVAGVSFSVEQAHADTIPSCNFTSTLNAVGVGTAFDNRFHLCQKYTVSYTVTTFTAMYVQLEGAADSGGTPGVYTAINPVSGTNPLINAGQNATVTFDLTRNGVGASDWLRFNLVSFTTAGQVVASAIVTQVATSQPPAQNDPKAIQTVAYSATPVIDVSHGDVIMTLSGNISKWWIMGLSPGRTFNLTFCQDSTGSRTIAGTPSSIIGFSAAPVSTASQCASQYFETYDGSTARAIGQPGGSPATFPVSVGSPGQVIYNAGGVLGGINNIKPSGSGANNVMLGDSGTLATATTGQGNVCMGNQTCQGITTGNENVAIGYAAGQQWVDCGASVAIGRSALQREHGSPCGSNTAVGYLSGSNLTAANENAAFGYDSLLTATANNGNAAFGAYALQNSTVDALSAFGYKALQANTTGTGSTALGYAALNANVDGAGNTAIGSLAGVTGTPANANVSGNNDTFIGVNSGPSSTTQISNATAIGANTTVTSSNTTVIGNSSVTQVYFGSTSAAANAHAAGFITGNTHSSMGYNFDGFSTASGNTYCWSSSATSSATCDSGLSRSAAATVKVGNGTAGDATGTIIMTNVQTLPVAVASLPACSAGTEGMHAAVNNSNAASYTAGIGAVVAAGGTTHVPVYCDGTNWRIG